MEKLWYPQRNAIDAPVALLKNFIHYIQLPVSRSTIEKETSAHPEFPLLSTVALSEILDKWGLKSITFKTDILHLKDIPSPSIIFINDERGGIKMGVFVMFYEVGNSVIEYLHPARGWTREPLTDFDKKWAQTAISLIDNTNPQGESDYEEKEKTYIEKKNANPDLKILRIKNDFLTNEECEYIISLSDNKFKKSTVMAKETIEIKERTSYSAELAFPDDEVLNGIRKKASDLIQVPGSHFEFFQCVSYEVGQEFQNHYDTFDETTKLGKHAVNNGGQRKYTLLVYLNDDFEGGATHFPDLDVLVQPKKGRVVIFDNLDEKNKVRKAAYHAGLPVTSGKKYAMNIWVRNKALNT